MTPDVDLLVVGNESEACLSAIAAARTGARTALVVPPGSMLGGLLTEDGLSFVDRDARHLTPPQDSPHDGLFGAFLARAQVPLVALEPRKGAETLASMLSEAGVTVLHADWRGVAIAGDRLEALALSDGEWLSARHFIDATPDGDLAEAAGLRFTSGFQEYGINRTLGVSPLPVVRGVTPERIVSTCQRLAEDAELEALRIRIFGERRFLELDHGPDYVLIGPPHLGLAYQRWREEQGIKTPYRFEADGFNVAVIGPDATSWNGLMYFSEDADTLLRLSRAGADETFRDEARHFERFLHDGLGWHDARVELPWGIYVRQTRHALDVRRRLSLEAIAREDAPFEDAARASQRVGTYCYYPDFRGFHAPKLPAPVTASVYIEPGLAANVVNLGIASRAGGYTPFAHSLCRLVQYNATLGVALGVAAGMAERDLGRIDHQELRGVLQRHGMLADDPAGFARNAEVHAAMRTDPVIALEGSPSPVHS